VRAWSNASAELYAKRHDGRDRRGWRAIATSLPIGGFVFRIGSLPMMVLGLWHFALGGGTCAWAPRI
jgi:hypothetical protein